MRQFLILSVLASSVLLASCSETGPTNSEPGSSDSTAASHTDSAAPSTSSNETTDAHSGHQVPGHETARSARPGSNRTR